MCGRASSAVHPDFPKHVIVLHPQGNLLVKSWVSPSRRGLLEVIAPSLSLQEVCSLYSKMSGRMVLAFLPGEPEAWGGARGGTRGLVGTPALPLPPFLCVVFSGGAVMSQVQCASHVLGAKQNSQGERVHHQCPGRKATRRSESCGRT